MNKKPSERIQQIFESKQGTFMTTDEMLLVDVQAIKDYLDELYEEICSDRQHIKDNWYEEHGKNL